MEAAFNELRGVEKVQSGYAGGHVANPSYEQVSSGETGHAESVQITFDPKVISYRDLLYVLFTIHNPTTLNRQGADEGTQYRSAIFYNSPEQKKVANEVIAELADEKVWSDPIVTQVVPFTNFYPAESYHDKYYERNTSQPYCQLVISPKITKLREKFADKLK
jgi:peptide-methionine (S)-S-oxide reductase